MKNAHYLTKTYQPYCMANLSWDNDPTPIYDAVEDAKDGADLVARLNKLNLEVKWTLDRETDEKVRLVGKDSMGNTRYFVCWK